MGIVHNFPKGDGPRNFDGGGGSGDDGGMEARVTTLETKWDAVVPTLATKADIESVKGDIHKMDASIKTWMMATVLTIIGTVVLGFTALFFNLSAALKPATPQLATQPSAPIIIQVPQAAPVAAPASPAASR